MLTVTNGNDFNFAGRFNGVDFAFPAGKTTALPEDAAKHIFGVGLADKTDVLVRHGWMTNGAMFACVLLNIPSCEPMAARPASACVCAASDAACAPDNDAPIVAPAAAPAGPPSRNPPIPPAAESSPLKKPMSLPYVAFSPMPSDMLLSLISATMTFFSASTSASSALIATGIESACACV